MLLMVKLLLLLLLLFMQAKQKIRIAVAEENQYIRDFYDFIAVQYDVCKWKCWAQVI